MNDEIEAPTSLQYGPHGGLPVLLISDVESDPDRLHNRRINGERPDGASKSAPNTVAPCAVSNRAVAAPIPEAAPVTSATRLERSPTVGCYSPW